MVATVTTLPTGRCRSRAGGPTVRTSIDAFLDSSKAKGNANTLRAYTDMLTGSQR